MPDEITTRSSYELDLDDLYDVHVATHVSPRISNSLDDDQVTVTSRAESNTRTTNTLDVEQDLPSKSEAQAQASDAISLTDQTNLLPFRKVIAVFSGLSLFMFVSTLDSVIVATALPTIGKFFDAGAVASWVPSAYLLTSTAFQPLCE